jgi:Glycosyl transferase family 2
MASWGLVTTLKAPAEKVLAFAAHHLEMGASHLALYFDDPEAVVPPVLANHPRITATLCNTAHWDRIGVRPPLHQNRQVRNARDASLQLRTDWLGHIDVDEFLLAGRPLSDMLNDVPPDQLVLKVEPYEAMHDPDLPDDIFTARTFRGAIRHEHWPLRQPALGEYRKYIRDGLLSHGVGKLFFRTGIRGLFPRIHTVRLKGEHVRTPSWQPELKLLHFHAQDRQAWLEALPFRLTLGAYQFNKELQAFLQSASAAEIDRFYLKTQMLSAESLTALQEVGRVVTADLHLRRKVERLLAGALG